MTKPNTLLHDILSHCLKLQQAGYPVFLDLSGHVDWITVHVVKSDKDYTSEHELYRKNCVALHDAVELTEVKQALSDLRIELGC